MGIVIGIGGVSRSGKTTLSENIKKWYPKIKVSILCMDKYVFPEDQIPTVRGVTDWEVPESVNYTRLVAAILRERTSNELVVVEGILIYNDPRMLSLFDRKIFVDIDYETFIKRKKQDNRWNEPEWFIEHIWTSYIIYGKVNIKDALVVSGSNPTDKTIVINYIGAL